MIYDDYRNMKVGNGNTAHDNRYSTGGLGKSIKNILNIS